MNRKENSNPAFGLPESYILLHENMNKARRLKIITAHGLTKEIGPGGGLPQGGKECPLHWRLFFDSLLVSLAATHPGFKTEVKSKHPIPTQSQNISESMVSSSFVDDTTLLATDIFSVQATLDHCQDFFKYAGIKVNAKKTKLIVINESPATTNLSPTIDGQPIIRSAPDKGERLLGIWISADGKWKTQREIIELYVHSTITRLLKVNITDQSLCYIINMVIIPNLLYKCKGLPLSETEIDSIDTRLRCLFKTKTGHGKDLPNIYLYHEKFYGLTSLKNRISEDSISNYQKRLEKRCPYTISREISLANNMLSTDSITSNPRISIIPTALAAKSPILSKIKGYMALDDITILPTHPLHNSDQIKLERQLYSIEKAVDDELIIQKYSDFLAKQNVFYIDQLISNDGSKTRTWKEIIRLYPKTRSKKSSPTWFQIIIKCIASTDEEVVATTSKSYRLNPALGLGKWNTFMGLNPCFDSSTTIPEIPLRSSMRLPHRKNYEHQLSSTETFELKREKDTLEEVLISAQKHRSITHANILSLTDRAFLKKIEAEGATLAVYTDGSAINQDTEYARARSAIFMARQSDIKEFEETTYIEMLNNAKLLLSTDDSGRAAEYIAVESLNTFKSLYSCVILSGEITDGPYQSWYGEYMALYQSLKALMPFPNIKAHVFTDHETLSNIFTEILTCTEKEFSAMYKLTGRPILSASRQLEQLRTQTTKIEWVKAHAGTFANVMADHKAGQYTAVGVPLPVSENYICPEDPSKHSVKSLTFFRDNLTQEPIRKILKKIHQTRDQMEGEAHLSKHKISLENDLEYLFEN
jgi:ribonuclease HI